MECLKWRYKPTITEHLGMLSMIKGNQSNGVLKMRIGNNKHQGFSLQKKQVFIL